MQISDTNMQMILKWNFFFYTHQAQREYASKIWLKFWGLSVAPEKNKSRVEI